MRDPDCTRCILHAEAKTVCLPSDGPDDADILFFGEAPGANEDEKGVPFVGNAGQELDSLLVRAKLPRKKVRISNTVRCRPPENRTPKEDERAACMFFTVQELQEVQPKVIVALGGSALKALTGEKAIGSSRGRLLSLLPEYRSDIPVLATYHPAAYLHNPGNREPYSKAIIADMKLAKKVVNGSVMKKKVITALHSEKKVRAAIKRLSKCSELACDLEWEVIPSKGHLPVGSWPWSKRNGHKPRVVSIAIAGKDGDKLLAVSVPLMPVDWAPDYAPLIRKLVEHIPTFYHHALGDLVWLYSLGWEVILSGCTFTYASLLDIESSRGLKPLTALLTDMPIGYERDSGVGTVPQTKAAWRKLLTYNGNDGIATVVLKPALKKLRKQQKRKIVKLYRHVLLPTIEILARTALNGTPINEKLLAKKRKKLLKDLRRDIEKIGDTLGFPEDYERTIGSSEKTAPYLERLLGIKLPRTAKSKKPSLTKDILLQNKKRHKIIPVMIRRSKEDKRETSYYRPWTLLLDQQQDHRLHTTYRLTNARSGRTSAESEAGNTFQQFPRKQAVRNLVEAEDEDHEIVAVDQSQIELRFIALRSRDRRMLEFFKEGKDLHRAIAGFMKALDKGHTLKWYLPRMDRLMEEVNKKERDGAKPINFGLGFGGGPGVIKTTGRKDYGIFYTDDQCDQGYEAYHQFYPDVRGWQETFWRDVERGYGENMLGRHRVVEEDNEGPEGVWRKYINFDIQGPASDLALFCMNYTWELLRFEYGKHAYRIVENIGFFHDAMLLHVLKKESDIVQGIVKQAWEHPPLERLGLEIDVPFVADLNVASVWKS